MFCSSCSHSVVDPSARYCPQCGKALFKENCCLVCHNAYLPDANYCHICGTPAGTFPSHSVDLNADPQPPSGQRNPATIEQLTSNHEDTGNSQKTQPVETANDRRDNTTKADKSRSRGQLYTRMADLGIDEKDWTLIPEGKFLMGSAESERDRFDYETQHEVSIGAFQLLKTPVTFTMYEIYCDHFDLNKPRDEGWGRGQRPVINISYWEIIEYCHWIRKKTSWPVRLPTEAEWEYACRAGTNSPFWNGEIITSDQANFDGRFTYNGSEPGLKRGMTTPVGEFEPNPWGLYDMHGNVWEWCGSEYSDEYNGMETLSACKDIDNHNPRVVRGGSWDNVPGGLRSASRNKLKPDYHFLKVGFRLARDLK